MKTFESMKTSEKGQEDKTRINYMTFYCIWITNPPYVDLKEYGHIQKVCFKKMLEHILRIKYVNLFI